jgi:16S rRNA processing protein RimM
MIVLGRIAAPYGIRGWVRVHPFADDPRAWCRLPRWWLGAAEPPQSWVPFDLAECREQGADLVAQFQGVEHRGAAEKLKGLLVAAPREALPSLEDGQYYWVDLIGLAVVNEDGEPLGRVAELISTGAHEVLAVRDETGHERLLPFVEPVVKEVNRSSGVIRVAWQPDW